jgi:hypothetical protein
MSSMSWQQETKTLRQAIIGMAEGEEKTRQEQAFAQRNASHALEQGPSNFTVIDPKKRPPKITKKEQRKKDAEEYARAKRQRKADEEDEEELSKEEREADAKKMKLKAEVEKYDGMISVLTANKDQELRKIEIIEAELANYTELETSTGADLTRFVENIDPALKCYFSAMHHLKNIVDYPGYERDDNNEILLELRASYDKFEAKYKAPWEAYEATRKVKTTAHTQAAMNKKHAEERVAYARRQVARFDRYLADRTADKHAAAAAAAVAPL